MTVDTIKTNSDNDVSRKCPDVRRPDALTSVALLCAFIGLVLCWLPIIGITHAVAAVILGAMASSTRHPRLPRIAVAVGIAATIAAVVFTITEVQSIQLVDTYDASPWV